MCQSGEAGRGEVSPNANSKACRIKISIRLQTTSLTFAVAGCHELLASFTTFIRCFCRRIKAPIVDHFRHQGPTVLFLHVAPNRHSLPSSSSPNRLHCFLTKSSTFIHLAFTQDMVSFCNLSPSVQQITFQRNTSAQLMGWQTETAFNQTCSQAAQLTSHSARLDTIKARTGVFRHDG